MSYNADTQHRRASRHAQVSWRECEDMERRLALEAEPDKWLKHYHAEAFSRPFEKPHYEIIDAAMHAFSTGGKDAVAAERGIGKSTILWGIVEMLALSGKSPFPVCVPWAASALKRAFKFWRSSLCYNPKLLADYPEVCAPFSHSRGVSQRLMATTWDGGPNDGNPTGAQLAIGEGLIVLPDNRGCMGGATINGNPRGLNHPMPDGRVMRPTLGLLDDVQDRAVAKSERMTQETIQIIDGDVAGMGEAGTELPMCMISNTIEDGDVMSHYLNHEQWNATLIPCVESWPDGWDDGNGATAKAWQDFVSKEKNGEKYKTEYKKRKCELCKGFVLSAPKTYEGNKKYPDAYFAVMATYFRMGKEAFHAEKQQKPIKQGPSLYQVTPKIIKAKTSKRQPGEVPDFVSDVVVAIDVNPSIGLTWVAVGFGANQGSVIDYGISKLNLKMNQNGKSAIIYEAIVALGVGFRQKPYPVRLIIFDVQGWGEIISPYRLSSGGGTQSIGITTIGYMGFGAKNYKPYYAVSKKGTYWHLVRRSEKNERGGANWVYYIAACSDYWKEISQKAWLGSFGAPGSVDLPIGNHGEFAQQICNEPLLSKLDTPMGLRWEYKSIGQHDFGDVMYMAWVGADFLGMGTGGSVAPVSANRRTAGRKVRHVTV